MKILVLLCACIGFITPLPTADITYARCESDLPARWPDGLRDDEIFFVANEKSDHSGPKYRLFSEEDVRNVKPETEYNFYLGQLDSEVQMKRFLISIQNFEFSDERDKLIGKDCNDQGPGMLKSQSDMSEHESYKCTKYLMERSGNDQTFSSVPFSWTSPKCGCVEINVEVLDAYYKLFTHDDDQFEALQIKSCVVPNKNVESGTDQVEMVENGDVEQLPNAEALVEERNPDERSPKKQGQKKQDKKEKKGKKMEKRQNRKRGKELCCSTGIDTRRGSESADVCLQVPEAVKHEALETFGLKNLPCSRVFKLCCQDEIKGQKKLNRMKQKNDQKP